MNSNETPTILVADDYLSHRQLYSFIFEAEGMNVLTVEDGLQLLEIAEQAQPSVILTDVDMPLMDGITALRALRENTATRRIPVLVHSADRYHRNEAMVAGAEGFFEKPTVLDTLISAVWQAVCRGRR